MRFVKYLLLIFIITTSLTSFIYAETSDYEFINIYIDQANGNNSSNTTGSEADPFKSITYAILKNRNSTLPLKIYIKSGIYDANPDKAPNEREIFPIELKERMVIEGVDGSDNCIISGAFNNNSQSSIFRGNNLSDFEIKKLTLKNMNRTVGNGGGIEINNCNGIIESCIFQSNRAKFGGGAYIYGDFTGQILDNSFVSNWAEVDGGGFCIWGNFNGSIKNNTLNGNTAQNEQGGAFHIEKNMVGNIINNSFNNNFADDNGNGFCIWGTLNGDLLENLFSDNNGKNGSNYGGAFYINNNINGQIAKNTFQNNSALYGGAFFVSGYIIGNLTENKFINNTVSRDGGGFYVENFLEGNISFNIFSENSTGEHYYKGAGFYIDNDLKGSITKNSFNSNSASKHGGGFYINKNLIGDLINNIFSNNSAKNEAGGGFDIEKNLTGDILMNTFSGNSAGNYNDQSFRILGILEGKIDKNLFSHESSFYLGANGSVPVIISNNYFVYRHIVSKQNLFVLNNTFYGSGVSLFNTANKSQIKNNIFANTYSAIWEEGELNLSITNNNFHNLTNILHRNNQEMGADSFFIEMLLPDTFRDNIDFSPDIRGEDLETGVWTENPVYDVETNMTIFTDTNQDWEEDEWVGAMINLSNSTTKRHHYFIDSNTGTQIKVWGYIVTSTKGQKDHIYSIDDYRLSAESKNIDAGITNNILYDFEKQRRPQGAYFDIGADEFFKGEMIHGIAHVDPPAKNITDNTATLQAQVNPNELSLTCYFEFGTDTTYGLTTSVLSGYTGSELFLINSDITDLSPSTEYNFRLVATNSTGTAYGDNQTFITEPITANIKGKIALNIAGHAGLVVKNAKIMLEGTNYITTTDLKGEFIFKNIPASQYKLIIRAENLLPIEQQINLSEGEYFDLGLKEMFVESMDGIEQTIQNAVITERMRWDSNGDNKKGIPEAINALQEVVEIK